MRKNKDGREILKTQDFVYYLSKRLNVNSDLIFRFIMEYASMIEESLLNDYEVELGRLGCFRIKDIKGGRSVQCRNFQTGEITYKSVRPFRRITFQLNKRIKADLNPKQMSFLEESIEDVERQGIL